MVEKTFNEKVAITITAQVKLGQNLRTSPSFWSKKMDYSHTWIRVEILRGRGGVNDQ
jgi:hypothetical protein